MTRCPRCRKRPFASYEAGVAAAIRVSSRRGKGMRVFECPAGVGWHLSRNAVDPATARRTA